MLRLWLTFQATHVRLWYDIEQHSTCDWDFLKISQSGSECSLCGKSHGVTDLGNLRGDINIYFKTDGSVQKRGFILWYRKVYTPCDGHTNWGKNEASPGPISVCTYYFNICMYVCVCLNCVLCVCVKVHIYLSLSHVNNTSSTTLRTHISSAVGLKRLRDCL